MRFPHRFSASLVFCAAALSAQAATPAEQAPPHPTTIAAPIASVAWTQGEVRKIDMTTGAVTLRHGRIENLDMPGMTMVFRAADPRQLSGLKVGDKVRFVAGMEHGALTVSTIERTE